MGGQIFALTLIAQLVGPLTKFWCGFFLTYLIAYNMQKVEKRNVNTTLPDAALW